MVLGGPTTADSQKLDYERRIFYAGVPSFFGLVLQDGQAESNFGFYCWRYDEEAF